ncbi:MAG: molecular chaperone DnaK [Dehalococcoidia bacterium]
MSRAIGIDLGTTNSVVAVMEGGEATVIPTSEGNRLTPSVVAVNKNNERLVGLVAKRQSVTNPDNTVFSVKRFMGRKFDDPIVQGDVEISPYKVGKAKNGDVRVHMGEEEYSPQEISAMVLQKLKAEAEAYLGEEVTEAVVTVPAYFNDSQRQATKDAGTIAGLDVLRIINEPTASSLAYGLDKEKEEVVAVFDLGGGTFDISVLEIGDGTFQVRSTAGDTHLGGDDFDNVIVDWMKEEFNKQEGIDLGQDRSATQRLREAAERAKQELSTVAQTELNLPFITADASGPKHLTMTLTRSNLEQLVEKLVARTEGPCLQAIEDAGLTSDKIDEVILVGGQSRMPRIQEKVKEIFGKEPNRTVNPDEAVSLGAAIQAGVLTGDVQEVLLLDVTPLTLGIETLGSVSTSIIPRNTTIPTAKSQVFSTAADGQTSVEIHVLQGERAMATDNKSLGRFILDGIAPSPRGLPQIEVTFDIDANGILNVSAVDKATSREQKIVIQAGSGLTPEEIEKMAQDAELNATEDAEKRANVEVRNQADTATFAAEKTLEEHSEHVTDEMKVQIEEKIKEIREGLTQDIPSETLSSLTQELSVLLQTIGEAVYQSTAEEGTEVPNSAEGEDGEPEVVEGEFKEV